MYAGLKVRAEDNNHAGDARSSVDKLLKAQQQKVLNFMRMVACLYPAVSSPEYAVLAQQLFFGLAEFESTIVKERKRRSIPQAVPTTANGLFTKQDLSISKDQAAINMAGVPYEHRKSPQCRFPMDTGSKWSKWKGAQPYGRGKGRFSGYGSQPGSWRPSGKYEPPEQRKEQRAPNSSSTG